MVGEAGRQRASHRPAVGVVREGACGRCDARWRLSFLQLIEIAAQAGRQGARLQVSLYRRGVLLDIREMGADKGAVDKRARALTDPIQKVRVGPEVRRRGKAVTDWIGVDVAAQVQQVFVAIDEPCVVRPFKECARVLVACVEGFDVSVKHILNQVARRDITILADEPVVSYLTI